MFVRSVYKHNYTPLHTVFFQNVWECQHCINSVEIAYFKRYEVKICDKHSWTFGNWSDIYKINVSPVFNKFQDIDLKNIVQTPFSCKQF